jgi:hypothetical protein
VSAGVGIFGVDGRGQGPDDSRQELGLLTVQFDVPAVNPQDRRDGTQQARLNRAELQIVHMVEGGQPSEQVFSLGQGD